MDALLGVLVGALFGFIGAYLKYDAEIRKIKAQYISANRKIWLNRVIDKIVDYITCIKHNRENQELITRLNLELVLLLNPTKEDVSIKDKKKRLSQELDNIINVSPVTDSSIKEILDLTRDILSHEWEMIKRDV